MLVISQAALGAIGAASFTAILSLLGLILTKEQKVSEFRQIWINELRSEISSYITCVNTIRDKSEIKYASSKERLEALGPSFQELNRVNFLITLRLNSSEEMSQEILSAMKDFNTIIQTSAPIDVDMIRPIEKRLLISSRNLLKGEWRRVKRGENTFIAAKYLSSAFIIIGVLLTILYFGQVDNRLIRFERDDDRQVESQKALTHRVEPHSGAPKAAP